MTNTKAMLAGAGQLFIAAITAFYVYAVALPGQQGWQVANVGLWVSFLGAGFFLQSLSEKIKDELYLYYLGVSGLRMLVFMFGLALTLFFVPGLRNPPIVLALALSYIGQTILEVVLFVRKLRQIFRNTPS
jgi:hypothetical protein